MIRGDNKKGVLFLARDCTDLVRALPAPDLYHTIKSVRDNSAEILVELANADQLNFMLNMDCWQGGHIDAVKFQEWVQILHNCDDQVAWKAMSNIEPDFLATALRPYVQTREISAGDVLLNRDVGMPYLFSPGDFEVSSELMEEFLGRLFSLDPYFFNEICMRMVCESASDVEWGAKMARDEQMQKHGIPGLDEATRLYRPAEMQGAKPIKKKMKKHAKAMVTTEGAELFLDRVIRDMDPDQEGMSAWGQKWTREVNELVKKVLIANDLGVTDKELARAVVKAKQFVSA